MVVSKPQHQTLHLGLLPPPMPSRTTQQVFCKQDRSPLSPGFQLLIACQDCVLDSSGLLEARGTKSSKGTFWARALEVVSRPSQACTTNPASEAQPQVGRFPSVCCISLVAGTMSSDVRSPDLEQGGARWSL